MPRTRRAPPVRAATWLSSSATRFSRSSRLSMAGSSGLSVQPADAFVAIGAAQVGRPGPRRPASSHGPKPGPLLLTAELLRNRQMYEGNQERDEERDCRKSEKGRVRLLEAEKQGGREAGEPEGGDHRQGAPEDPRRVHVALSFSAMRALTSLWRSVPGNGLSGWK